MLQTAVEFVLFLWLIAFPFFFFSFLLLAHGTQPSAKWLLFFFLFNFKERGKSVEQKDKELLCFTETN